MPNARPATGPPAPPAVPRPASGAPPTIPRLRRGRLRRARRCHDAVAELVALQVEYEARLEALPETLQDTATAEALRTICEFDLADLQAIEPPRGFGRDRCGG